MSEDIITSTTATQASPETTDLERRVLAHERILQSLIAFMSRTEPRFVDHLWERFVVPMEMTRREHEYRDVDDYAEEFIRAVTDLEEIPISRTEVAGQDAASTGAPVAHRVPTQEFRSTIESDRVQIQERNGIWQVRVDGAFRGDYHQKRHALAAAALARLSLQ